MQYINALQRLILGASVLSCALAYTIVSEIHLPKYLASKQLTDSQVQGFASKAKSKPEIGNLVMYHQQNGCWAFGVVVKQGLDGYYDIENVEKHVVTQNIALSSIKTLSSTWNYLFHPNISLDEIRKLLDERNNYYRMHGAPDGHGMILPARSKIIVFGDLHGNFKSLQNHFAQLYKDGLIDDQLNLKAGCYVFGLGDYAGEGGQSIPVLYTLLKLQENNPDQVFLLRGDHEDATKSQANGFQKEWYGTFGKTQKDFCLAELVWLKMLMLWKSLPKVLLVGLQMPSTQHYDFLMFCHSSCDYTWRPEQLMSKVVEKHIDQLYKNPCILDYRGDQTSDLSFAKGTFTDDADVATKTAKARTANQETVWSKSAFEQFVHQYASRIDKKHMYQYCLYAMVRGHEHIPGGIVAFKRNGLNLWKPLKDNKMYAIEPCSIYTCTSGSHCMSKAGCFDGAFGLIEASPTGHWYITSHLEA